MKVYLSVQAQEQLTFLLDYLERNWPPKVRDNFLAKLDASLAAIGSYPESFPASQKMPGVRRCVVTTQTVLYYRTSQEAIEVIALTDARQDIG